MMKLYCIHFYRMYDDDNVEREFFVYAKTKLEAVRRFCNTTGYKKSCIVFVNTVLEV